MSLVFAAIAPHGTLPEAPVPGADKTHEALAELAETYTGAERWVRDVVSERAPVKNWPRTLATAEDAAFHLYQRGAVDYRP